MNFPDTWTDEWQLQAKNELKPTKVLLTCDEIVYGVRLSFPGRIGAVLSVPERLPWQSSIHDTGFHAWISRITLKYNPTNIDWMLTHHFSGIYDYLLWRSKRYRDSQSVDLTHHWEIKVVFVYLDKPVTEISIRRVCNWLRFNSACLFVKLKLTGTSLEKWTRVGQKVNALIFFLIFHMNRTKRRMSPFFNIGILLFNAFCPSSHTLSAHVWIASFSCWSRDWASCG